MENYSAFNLSGIIPEPVQWERSEGEFLLNEETRVMINTEELRSNAEYFQRLFKNNAKILLQIEYIESIEPGDTENTITFTLGDIDPKVGSEGYHFRCAEHRIDIAANNLTGIFHGIQSLRQLLPPEIENSAHMTEIPLKIACIEIIDYPRFSWRGYMLDEARHFFGLETVKKLLDLLALHKMNIFHWHLTDDQGWRIEIKQYPKLTEIGSIRKKPIPVRGSYKDKPGPLDGFYTQEQIQEIIEYAAQRYIQIIPEIEMPGHTLAAIASYPFLSCHGRQLEVATYWGVIKDVYCPGKEEVFSFIENILQEIMALFPSSIIHTGGDEVPKTNWKLCPACIQRMKDQNFTSVKQLQPYFSNRIADFLAQNNKRIMGWNEFLDPGLNPKAICHYWQGPEELILSELRKGRDLVNSHNSFTYLSFNYNRIPLSKCYSLEPIPRGLPPNYEKHMLGVETCAWTEGSPNERILFFRTFPRLSAIAEVGWSPDEKQVYENFRARLDRLLKRFDVMKINYAPAAIFEPSEIKTVLSYFKTQH